MVCGCESWEEITDYGKTKKEWLATFLELPSGIPSESTIRRVFTILEPKSVESVYRDWVAPYIGGCMNKQIGIDGKTVCGVGVGSGQQDALHIVSAWIREDGISFGQIKTETKSNEITAIPLLIDSFDISGGTVTIDAMGCQKTIVERIIEKEANYILAVKGNQPQLMMDIKEYFDWAKEDAIESKNLGVYKEEEWVHGRKYSRTVYVTNDVSWYQQKGDWGMLRSFVCIERTRIDNKGKKKETHYYISSLIDTPKRFAQCIRGHWSIENNLHWSLDAIFHEDSSLIHTGHAPENLSLLRKFALALLKSAQTDKKMSIRRKQRIASYDDDFALSAIGKFK